MSLGYRLIASHKDLIAYCDSVRDVALIAVDTEFVGERTYYPLLELIQVSDGRSIPALIDVRAVGDPEPLAKLLGDPEREKIMHSSSQDIALLERYLGVPPLPVFDTQLAAAMAGMGAQVSYANLVRECVGPDIDKKHTVSDWSKRPLNPGQLEYAAVDVLHLHPLRESLSRRLDKLGRLNWFKEEQARRAEEWRRSEAVPDEEMHTTVKEWTKLNERKLAVLRELAIWREHEARRLNVPRKQVMQDYTLIALAQISPSKREDIQGHRQIPVGQVQRNLDTILQLVKKAKELPKDKWPKKPAYERPDVPAGFVELLQALVRAVAEEQQIAPGLLATSSELAALVNNRDRLDDLKLPVLTGWRREMIGEHLVELLKGRMHLRIENGTHLVFDR